MADCVKGLIWKLGYGTRFARLNAELVRPITFLAGTGKAVKNAAKAKGAEVFNYEIHPGKSPKVIEATGIGGKGKLKGLIGLYEVEGDTLKLCIVPGGTKAPSGFKTTPNDDALVLELKRDKK